MHEIKVRVEQANPIIEYVDLLANHDDAIILKAESYAKPTFMGTDGQQRFSFFCKERGTATIVLEGDLPGMWLDFCEVSKGTIIAGMVKLDRQKWENGDYAAWEREQVS